VQPASANSPIMAKIARFMNSPKVGRCCCIPTVAER
jgi:hypothetical protein